MRFLNNLYIIIGHEQQENAVRYDLELNQDHEIFMVHFPGHPITPGVCLLQIGRELLEIISGMPLEIELIKNVKFLSVISPVETIRVSYILSHIQVEEEVAECRVLVTSSEKEPLAKLSFKCRKRGK